MLRGCSSARAQKTYISLYSMENCAGFRIPRPWVIGWYDTPHDAIIETPNQMVRYIFPSFQGNQKAGLAGLANVNVKSRDVQSKWLS